MARTSDQRPSLHEITKISLEGIKVIGRRRPVIPEKVREIADSMATIGLRHPITVRYSKTKGWVLVTGLHRLEAAKSLGWKKIDCIRIRGGKTDRRLWLHAENL